MDSNDLGKRRTGASRPPSGRHGSGPIRRSPTRSRLGAGGLLLITLLGGWVWSVRGNSDPGQTFRAADLREDLLGAHNSLLGAYVHLYEGDFFSARRQLEDARGLLRRADERSRRLGWRDDVMRLDLAGFESDIDEAQRLLSQLDQQAHSLVPMGQGIVTRVPGGSTFRQR